MMGSQFTGASKFTAHIGRRFQHTQKGKGKA